MAPGKPPEISSGDSNINPPSANQAGNANLARNVYQFDGNNNRSDSPNQYQFSGGGGSCAGDFFNYQVKQGDTLYSIAENQVTNNGMACPTPDAISAEEERIIQANKDKYPSLECNPNLIGKGWDLKIPIQGNSDQGNSDNSQHHKDNNFGFDECACSKPDVGPRTPSVNDTPPPGAVNRHSFSQPGQPAPAYGEGAGVPNYSARRTDYVPPADPVQQAYQAAQIRTYGEFGNPNMGGMSMGGYNYGGMGGMMGGYNPMMGGYGPGGMMYGGYNPMLSSGMMGGYNPMMGMMGGYNPMMMGGMGYGMGMGMGMGNNMQMTETYGPGGMTMSNSPTWAPSPGVAGFAGDTSALTSAFMPILNFGSTLAMALTGKGGYGMGYNPMMMGGMF